MKIQRVEATNFLKLRDFTLDLKDETISLICGHNEAGKSSFQEALRFGMLGETVRVSRKSDYPMMIRDGASEASITVREDMGVYVRQLKAKGQQPKDPEYPEVFGLEFLLDATRYAWTDPKKRREFVFKLLQVKFNRDDVGDKMVRRGVPEAIVEQCKPLLRAGFDSASAEASKKATAARSEWKGITGENYGSDKATEWKPVVEAIDPAALVEAEKNEANELRVLEDQIERRGALSEKIRAAKIADAKGLEDQPGMSHAVGQPEGKPEGVYPEGHNFKCPACKVELNSHMGTVRVITEADKKADPLPARKKAKKKVSKKKASKKVAKKGPTPEERELGELEAEIATQRQNHSLARTTLDGLLRQHELHQNADNIAKQAFEVHQQVESWKRAAELLAPTGIPGEIISDQIKPLNDRLRATATSTGWGQVTVRPDMEVEVEGRHYGLQSESAQWRAQVAIAEAISAISGVGLLVIDRMDVLDLGNRARLMKWLCEVEGDHNNIIVIGTLKAAPQMPPNIGVHWMENGELA